jgi:hypothetical protein
VYNWVIELFCWLKVGNRQLDRIEKSDEHFIEFPVQDLNDLTTIPNAGDLFDFITSSRSFCNTKAAIDELGFKRGNCRINNVRIKTIILDSRCFWKYDLAHSRIPELMNPIMDSIMKGHIEKQEEV